MAEERIFLSAVSSEFRSARKALTEDFGTRNVHVRMQEHFRPEPQVCTLLEALDDYIRTCTMVVCIIGRRSGDCPKPDEVTKVPGALPGDVDRASYTQWEYYLARHYGKPCVLYLARNNHTPDDAVPSGPDFPDLQRAFVAQITGGGLRYVGFTTVDELCRKVGLHYWQPRRIAMAPDPQQSDPPAPQAMHDVFLSYSHSDGQWVEQLARRLRSEHGFRVWLDRWVLVPGKSWQREMDRGLERAHCCAVCINNAEPNGWFRQELERALDLQTRNSEFRVIPVLLPEASPNFVPGFLSLGTWADFRVGQDLSRAFHVLSQGIRGEPVGPWPPIPSHGEQASLSVHERKILELQRFRTLGIHEEVVIEYERRILADWFHGGD